MMELNTLSYMLLLLAFLMALHQYLMFGSWFELKDVHHEAFILAFGFAGILLMYVSRRRE